MILTQNELENQAAFLAPRYNKTHSTLPSTKIEFLSPGYVPTLDKVEADPTGRRASDVGSKLDAGKNRAWLFTAGFAHALEEVSKVTTLGAQKYTPNGWVEVPDGINRYMDAYGRHAFKLGQGEIKDTGPGGLGDTYHIAQMIWNLLAAFELQLRNEKISNT